jgi:PAS domain S-box-containing protein
MSNKENIDPSVFKKFVEISDEGIGYADLDSNIVYANQKLCDMFGEKCPEDLYGKSVLQYYTEYFQGKIANEVFPQVREKGSWDGELIIQSIDGNLLHTDNHLFVLTDDNGKPLYYANRIVDLGEKRKAKESEDKFQHIFKTSPMGMYMYELNDDNKLILIDSNPAADEFTGIDNIELIGKDMEVVFPSLKDSEIAESYKKAARDGVSCHSISYAYTDDRVDGVFDIWAFQISPGQVAVQFMEISDRAKSEEDVLWLSQFPSENPNPVLRISKDGEVLYSNNASECTLKFWGVDKNNNKLSGDMLDTVQKCVEEKTNQIVESYCWCGTYSVTVTYVANEDYVNIYALNITELKNIEIALEESKNKLRQWLEHSPICTKILDTDFNLQFMSNAGVEALKIDDITKYYGMQYPFDFYPEDFKRDMRKSLQKVRKTIKTVILESTVIDTKGSEILFHSTIIPVMENDKLDYIMVVSVDVTKQKATEKQLQLSAIELIKSNKELEEFAYVASHDLQEPLRVVSSYCQLIKEKNYKSMDEDSRKFLDYSVEAAMRMKTLIKELLDFSRVGRKDQPFEKIDLQELLSEVMFDFEVSINETQAKIILESNMPQVMGIRIRLKQLFHNIISNSLKFKSERIPSIKIGCCEDVNNSNQWLFYIKDNGIGLESKFYDRIFGVFKRLYSREEYPGTGIGLALCKKIVEAHGGKIWVESEVNVGTYVYFTISKAWVIFDE